MWRVVVVWLSVCAFNLPVLAQTETNCVQTPNAPICAQSAKKPTSTTSPLADPIAATINFDQWMGVIGEVLDSVSAKKIFRDIGLAIVGIAAFFLSFQVISKGGIFEGLEAILLRIFIAAAIFAAADPIGDLWKDTWSWGYKYSTQSMGSVYAESAKQLAALSADLPTAIIKVKTIKASSQGQNSASVQLQTPEKADWVETMWLSLIVPLSGLMYICLSGFYTSAVLASVVTIIIGKIVFPLVAAALVFPGEFGLSTLNHWIRAMTSAMIMGFFLPLLYGVASFVAVLIPLSHVQAFIAYVDQVVNNLKAATEAIKGSGIGVEAANAVINQLVNVWGIGDMMATVAKLTGIIVVLPLALLIGLLVASAMIMKASNIVTSLIGGLAVGGGYENPIARGAAMLWGPGAVAAIGGAAASAGGMMANTAGNATKAVGSAAGSATGAVAGVARSAGTSAALNYASIRAATPMPVSSPGISRAGASPSVPNAMRVQTGGGNAGSSSVQGGLGGVEQRNSAIQSASGKFVNDGYNRANTLRNRLQGSK